MTRLPGILAATSAALLLAACGGGSSGDDTSSGEPDDAKRLAFAECMRKAGFKVPDPRGREMAIQIPRGFTPSRVEKIHRDCARKTGGDPGGGKPPSKAEQAKFLDQALKFARCMRSHGVDIPDPQASGGGIRIGGPRGGSGGGPQFDPSSPAFRRAQEECKSFLPGGKGGPALSRKREGGGGPSIGMSSGKASQ